MRLELNGKRSSSKRTRHLNIRYFYITDQLDQGWLTVRHCPTEDMVGDFFTKPLQGQLFRRLRSLVMNCPVDVPPDYMSPRDTSRVDTGVCWDIAPPDRPEAADTGLDPPGGPGTREGTGAGPLNGPGTGTPGPGQPGTEHAGKPSGARPDTRPPRTVPEPMYGELPRTRPDTRPPRTTPEPTYGGLKVSGPGRPDGRNGGRTVPPSTYGGELKVSGRKDPAGRNTSGASALWDLLGSHARRLGSLSSLA